MLVVSISIISINEVYAIDTVITHNMMGGSIVRFTTDVEAHSLIIAMTASQDGSLVITLSRSLIDAKMGDDGDDTFFVLVNNEEVDFEETTTSTDRTLTIQFPANAKEIEIIGTTVNGNYFKRNTTPIIPINNDLANIPDTVYKDHVYSIKSHYYDLANALKKGIISTENTLSGTSFENSEAKKKVDTAWSIREMAWTSHGKIDSELKLTENYLESRMPDYAYTKLLQIDQSAYSLKEDLYAIMKEVKDAQILEKKYQESKKTCVLFWCYGDRDTYSGVNSKIQDLESKLKTIESKLSLIESEKNKVSQAVHKYEITEKNLEIKKLENLRKQDQYQAEQELREQQYKSELERQRLEEQKQRELQEQQYQADMQEQQYQEQIENKERQRIIEEARTHPLLQGIIDGTLYFYIEPIPSYYKVPGIDEAVDNIANSLESEGSYLKIRRTYDENSAGMIITWVKDFGSSKLGHAIFKRYVEVELGSDDCWGKWQPYTTSSIKKVMWHEIGHSLGYSHSTDPNNVMYESTYPQLYQDVSHTFSLESGYSQWFNFCHTGTISFHAKSSKDTDGFNVYAIPPDDPRGFSDNAGLRYKTNDGSDCGASNMISITKQCNVGSGAWLHFKNNEFHTIYITFEMYDQNYRTWPEMTWDQKAFHYDIDYLIKVRDMFH